MIRWIKKWFFICYNNETLRYIFFGGLTTLVNLVVYRVCRVLFHFSVDAANITSIILAILFAYFVNSRLVFQTKADTFREHFQEFVKFLSARASTMLIETFGLKLMVDVIHMNDFLGKVLIQVIVMILNYVFSKLLVFRQK